MQGKLRDEVQGRFFDEIYRIVSRERLKPYIDSPQTNSLIEAFTMYMYNATISEALYVPLQNYEVGLRNGLHNVLKAAFGTAEWYLQEATRFGVKSQDAIRQALDDVSKRKIDRTPGDVIAQLHLGFWHSVLSEQFQGVLWPTHILEVFPYAPFRNDIAGDGEKQKELERIYDLVVPIAADIKGLRNRVYHYEPIIWKHSKLDQLYSDLIRATSWISPDLKVVTRISARYEEIARSGREHFQREHQQKLESYFDELARHEEERLAAKEARKQQKKAEQKAARLAKKM